MFAAPSTASDRPLQRGLENGGAHHAGRPPAGVIIVRAATKNGRPSRLTPGCQKREHFASRSRRDASQASPSPNSVDKRCACGRVSPPSLGRRISVRWHVERVVVANRPYLRWPPVS